MGAAGVALCVLTAYVARLQSRKRQCKESKIAPASGNSNDHLEVGGLGDGNYDNWVSRSLDPADAIGTADAEVAILDIDRPPMVDPGGSSTLARRTPPTISWAEVGVIDDVDEAGS